ncbi:MAG: YeeE/YedE thiosulfate transporter family protein [Thalassobaculum sp.]|uniref:YeeE/YedE thiosulfate transporter family protein n=1 Tax=Thalassobaculum sp. TaxID=2022740 RepID=UPI0032EDEF6C
MDALAVGIFEGWEPEDFLLLFGGLLGLGFGALAQWSGFCFRAAVAETTRPGGDRPKLAQWIAATAVAIALTQAGIAFGLVDVTGTPYLQADFSLGGLVVGGLLFGVGMSFAGGCISRLSVLAVRGNLRSVFTLLVVAVVGYAAIRGLLAQARAGFADGTRVPGGDTAPSIPDILSAGLGLPVATVALALGGIALVGGLALALRTAGRRPGPLAVGAAVGLLVAFGFAATSWVAAEAFDPVGVESLRFTQPSADALMYGMISTGVAANFGIIMFAGVLAGAFLQAAAARSLRLEGFDDPAQMARAGLGGVAMGVGGVLALGCAVGQGLSGVATLAYPSIIALAAIWAGARLGFAWRAGIERRVAATA